jgi:radical SAM protein with 4Fe4S-binding SPASM domain
MIDIDFFMKAHDLKRRIMSGGLKEAGPEVLLSQLEEFRNPEPVVYNIETTNACNMRCQMCPRTTLMTRRVEHLEPELFARIVKQLRPHPAGLWARWERFVRDRYGIPPTQMSENHFYLHVIPKVVQLHGYGDPLLDRNMASYVAALAEGGFPSYFSCNPANIDVERTMRMFENGLTYIKYSIETVDNALHRRIRGKASDFSNSCGKIMQLLELKAKRGYRTAIVITMLNLNRRDQFEDFERLQRAFAGADVYIYLKSEDQLWYRKNVHKTSSIHWSEMCQHPWMSMTVKSNGEVAMCMEDFNNEIVLGDARREFLGDIWNGPGYARFRRDQVYAARGIKCHRRCDMNTAGDLLSSTIGLPEAGQRAVEEAGCRV